MTDVAHIIEQALGRRCVHTEPLAGGCVGEVYRAQFEDGAHVVAKVDRSGSPRLDIEGAMLRALAGHLTVPDVLHAEPSLLIMEFIDVGGDDGTGPGVQEHAADCIAALHDVSADAFGFPRDTLIGGLRQPNPWTDRWIDFFREQRLLFMAREAASAGRLPADTLGRVERLAGRLDALLPSSEQLGPPSLIHGDLWGGNVLAGCSRVLGFIDPAVYFAHAEIELAFSTLFGTFGDRFFARYAEHRPLLDGFFETRRDLYNLYPLLVHVRLFGGGYVGQVESILRRFT
ncbi:MAG: fructosamine kinase family protein [Planctomycetota bacterium]